MLRGMAEAMMDKGYVNTTVADVIKRAGVSRETFYQQFSSKSDCFMTAFDEAADLLIGDDRAPAPTSTPTTLAVDDERDPPPASTSSTGRSPCTSTRSPTTRATARLFLVEVYAAGPEAIRRRVAIQQQIVDVVATILGVAPDDEPNRFACEVLVAAVGSMVTEPLVSADPSKLRDLHDPLMSLVRRAVSLTT